MTFSRWLLCLAPGLLAGCAVNRAASWQAPQLVRPSPADVSLLRLPPPERKLPIAVYGFTDQTGQFKTTTSVQTLSRAVTQGGTSILVKALQDAGRRSWFQVIERERLDDLLRERAVIREMRQAYLNEKDLNTKALPPLLFAGLLLEGGVIGYDSNVKTGGLGARFLGIGGNVSYQEDSVTVYLRAVSTKTGEVLVSVNARKSISSILTGTNTFRYVGFQDLLEIDGGFTANEPVQLALQQAIEKAVYGLIMEGTEQGIWCFRTTPDAAMGLMRRHIAERDHLKPETVQLPLDASGKLLTGACPVGAPLAALPNAQPAQGAIAVPSLGNEPVKAAARPSATNHSTGPSNAASAGDGTATLQAIATLSAASAQAPAPHQPQAIAPGNAPLSGVGDARSGQPVTTSGSRTSSGATSSLPVVGTASPGPALAARASTSPSEAADGNPGP